MSTKELAERTSDTPRTDALLAEIVPSSFRPNDRWKRLAEFARQLERELLAKGDGAQGAVALSADEVTQPGWYAQGDRFVEVKEYEYPVYVDGILRSSDPKHLKGYRKGLLVDGSSYPGDWGDDPFVGPLVTAAFLRPCTCHPDDNPPRPCPRKYALSECRAAAPPVERDDSKGENT